MERWQLLAALITAIFGSTGFWSWLSQRKASNKDILNAVKSLDERVGKVEKNVNKVEEKVATLSDDMEKERAESSRVRFLRFNGELIRGDRHTLEEFTQAMYDIDRYQEYCKNHDKYENSKAEMAIKNIKRCYDKCQAEHDFL